MLQFPLCYRCAHEYKDRSTLDPEYNCLHSEADRSFTVTTTHNELNLALDKGYRVSYLDRVYTFPRWEKDLFKSYVRKFMKLKIEATGWPKYIDDMQGGDEKECAKETFIRENGDRYGISIDAKNMIENPAKRQIAKLCLNSLWVCT